MDARFAERQTYDPADDPWDGYLMSNIRPKTTGLPMVVWLQHGEGVRHEVRVKVSSTPGDRISHDNLAVVSVRPEPRLLHGELSNHDFEAVARWIKLNQDAIFRHWEGLTDSAELFSELKRL